MTQSAFSGKDITVYEDDSGFAALAQEIVGWTFSPTRMMGKHASTQTDGHMASVNGPQDFAAEITVKVPSSASGLSVPWNIGDSIKVRLIADGGSPTADYIEIEAKIGEAPVANAARATPDGVEITYALHPAGVRPIYHGIFWSGSGSSGQVD